MSGRLLVPTTVQTEVAVRRGNRRYRMLVKQEIAATVDQHTEAIKRLDVSLHLFARHHGEKMQGHIKSFDSFCVLVDSSGDLLLYKHAISSITSVDGNFRLHGGRD